MIKTMLSTLAFAALVATATGASHAQVPPPGTQVTAPGVPVQGPGTQLPGPQGCPQRVTPSASTIYNRTMQHFSSLGLAPQQQQQIQSAIGAFSQTHPAGTPLNVPAMRQLHQQIRGVLTPQQLATLEQMNHQQRPPMPHPCA